MRPLLAFLGGVAGLIGGAVIGVYAGRAIDNEGIGYVISGVLMFVLGIAGYSWGGGRESKPTRPERQDG